MACIKVVFGGAMIGPHRDWNDQASLDALYAVLDANGVKTIDTAQLYGEGDSERILGETGAGPRFTIDTKAKGGFGPGTATKDSIISMAAESMKRLKVDKVDVFYIHAPDASIPIADTLAGINAVHQAGQFTRFGLSNYKAEDVQAIHDHCKAHNYVLPTVYQGNYSPVARKQDTLLFPLLHKLHMSFYAYSPLAGGFLTKTKQQFLDGVGRFDTSTPIGKMYAGMYGGPAYLDALAQWDAIATDTGCSKADLAYRWVAYNSPLEKERGDAIIVGASSLKQLEQTLEGLKHGPLDEATVKRIDQIWEKIEPEAPLDNYHR